MRYTKYTTYIIYKYMYVCMYVCIYIYIYIYIYKENYVMVFKMYNFKILYTPNRCSCHFHVLINFDIT
jgi:hypothetical protein